MSSRRVRAVARRVVEQFRHDHRSMGLMFVVPLVILTLIGLLLQPVGSARRAPVALVNEDRGVAGVSLGGIATEALLSASSLDARVTDAAAAEEALRRAEVYAIVRFGPDFTEEALRSQRLVIGARLEGSDPFLNANTAAALQKAVQESLASALARTPLAARGGGIRLDVGYLYGGAEFGTLDYFAPVLIPFLAFFFVFLLTDVAFLRERASGTLERLMATPLRRGELVAGYVLGLSVFALLQSLVVVLFSIFVLNVRYRGNLGAIFLVEAVMVLGAVNLGLLLSAFARNEFQAVQFIPIVMLPQVLLSGILIPIADLPDLLRPLAWLMPLTYANEALRAVMIKGFEVTDALVLRDVGVLALFAVAVAALATTTIRREVA